MHSSLPPILDQISQGKVLATGLRDLTLEETKLGEFSNIVFADPEDIWKKIFKKNGLDCK
jgi:predicted metalloprotease